MSRLKDPDIFFTPVAELNGRLKKREFSARDLVETAIDRLQRFGPRYNAVAHIIDDDAIDRAKDIDGDMKRERFRGPLQGIPFGVKDLLSVGKHPTRWGAKPYENQVFEKDSVVVRKLHSTGAVAVAKLAMVELAGGGGYRYPAASLNGPGLNPWDLTRWAGGSSSGSGAAVAAGIVPFAIGSETWGSILTPCAFCGVTGLRPTYGLVSRRGGMALSWSMDKIGPIARTVEDCALVLQEISGGDAEDPGSAGKSFYYNPQFARDPKDLTIGFSPSDFSEAAAPETRAAFQAALEAFRSIGTKIEEVDLPDFPYRAAASATITAEGSAAFEELIRSGLVDQLADEKQIAGLKAGLDLPASDYLRAQRIRLLIQRSLRNVLYKIDVLLAPARYETAPPVDQPLDRRRNADSEPASLGLRDLSAAGNLAGLPALVLPCGLSENGLPIALQLVGRPFTENTLVGLGKAFQERTDWHLRRPPNPAA